MAPTPCPSCRGYTLVELLIGMGLALLIVGGMWLALQSQKKAYRAQGTGREERSVLRSAVQQLEKDLQLAGAGLPRWTAAIVPGQGDGNPVLTIRYITDPPFVTKLTAPASERSRLFRIPPDDIRHFAMDDQVLILFDGARQSFRVEAVGSHSSPHLKLTPEETPGGSQDRTVWSTFPPGSEVVRVRDWEIQYLLVPGEGEDHTLIRRRGARETVVATHVQDLRIDYLFTAEGNGANPRWTSMPPVDTPILGARVHLTVGHTTTHFTVTRRNLSPNSAS